METESKTAGAVAKKQPTLKSTEDKNMEEVNVEQEKADQAANDEREKKAAMSKIMANLKASIGMSAN